MLRSLKELEQYTVSASDGELGKVVSFLVDDAQWTVPYLSVELAGPEARKVLLSTTSLRPGDLSLPHLSLDLTRDEIRQSPALELDDPVSRHHERGLAGHYGYPDTGDGSHDVHLHGVRQVRGFQVRGRDEAIGHVDDLIVDAESWQVRYLVVDTRTWWYGHKVLLALAWVGSTDWLEREVQLETSRASIKGGPSWRSSDGLDRSYERRLHDHHGKRPYWISRDERAEAPTTARRSL